MFWSWDAFVLVRFWVKLVLEIMARRRGHRRPVTRVTFGPCRGYCPVCWRICYGTTHVWRNGRYDWDNWYYVMYYHGDRWCCNDGSVGVYEF